MSYVSSMSSGSQVWTSPFRNGDRLDAATLNAALDPDELARRVLAQMYLHPVIVVCDFCSAANAISNPTCIACNAPMGNSKRKGF